MGKEFHMRKKKSYRGTILIIGLAILMFITTIKYIPDKPEEKIELPETQEASALNTNEDIRLKNNSAVRLKTVYNCGHIKTKTSETDEKLVGKTQKEIESLHPEWKIDEFSDSLISAEITSDSPCENHYIIKLKGDTLHVYRKNNQNESIREQKISTSSLASSDIAELTAGISAETEFEVLEILESFIQ